MGRLLAEAASMHEGLNVVQTRSYGPEARGGASKSQVVISSGEIDDLRNPTCDILVCLSQQACDRYYSCLREDGVFIVDSTNVGVVPTTRALELPMTRLATETCGSPMMTNVVGLGVLSAYTKIVSLAALKRAVNDSVKPNFRDQNIQALELGHVSARDMVTSMPETKRERIPNFANVLAS